MMLTFFPFPLSWGRWLFTLPLEKHTPFTKSKREVEQDEERVMHALE
jgi:hypothetical protein